MRLAITMRQVVDPRHGELRDALSRDWSAYAARQWPDAALLPLPNRPEAVESWAESLNIVGAILSNGNDWGEAPARDATETRLVAWCRAKGRPVLGVCRGLQALNVMLGGAIETDIAAATGQAHGGVTHEVGLVDATFARLAGADRLTVNSYHDQGVSGGGLAPPFRPFAMAEGDVVEGFYHAEEPLLAIQWHPERPDPAAGFSTALIQGFFARGAFWREHGEARICTP